MNMNKIYRFAEPAVHVIIWSSAYLVFIFLIKTIGPFKRIDGTILMPVTFGTVINIIIFYVTSLVLIPRLAEKGNTRNFLILLPALLLALTLAETLIDSVLFRVYYSDRKESFFSQLLLNTILNCIILSLALGYGFTKSWIKNEKMKRVLLQEKLSAELNFMKSQLNPHFLFNVLNMAYSSANRSSDETTADIIEKLSGLLRYMLYESNVEYIELEKEITYLRNYINLQKMRFPEDLKVKVNFQLNGDFSRSKIAPLILIQFIENAFKFGVKLEKESEILVSLSIINNDLKFIVSNPIYRNTGNSDKNASGIGIRNVKKRLEILYAGKHSLIIEDSGELFCVRLIMNLK
jgi:two-component system, LytTR family, sensor kinase